MWLFAISDTHKREKANLLATKSPTFGSHSSANGHVPHAYNDRHFKLLHTITVSMHVAPLTCPEFVTTRLHHSKWLPKMEISMADQLGCPNHGKLFPTLVR